MKLKRILLGVCAVFAFSTTSLFAQESDFEISAGADLVSNYVWRGEFQTGAAVQPNMSASIGGFSLTAWGSTPFESISAKKEFDLTLGYTVEDFTVAVTDYWWTGEGIPYFDEPGHYLEAMVAYTLPEAFPLSISVSTMLAGYGDKSTEWEQRYSTYIEMAYPFVCSTIDCTAKIGVTPFEGYYSDKFDVCALSLRAAKDVKVTDDFALPLFTEAIFSPSKDRCFFIFGVSLGL